MANLLWGKVFFKDDFAGILHEEPGDRYIFTYDKHYIESDKPPISITLPIQKDAHISQHGLHPFFDNLVAEGWMEEAQTRMLGRRSTSRFELLLAFGYDLAGAVYIIDSEPSELSDRLLDAEDKKSLSAFQSRASLSGVQPKLAAVIKNGILRPTKIGELSQYIIKFPSQNHNDLVANEYLTTMAFRALLPKDDVVDMCITEEHSFDEPILAIKRFDRDKGGNRLHFEEFNQLLNLPSHLKYDHNYDAMANVIRSNPLCTLTDSYKLYLRIIAGIVLGNTDMHLKNFAMFHTDNGLRLTPSYDQVAACLYNYKTLALGIHHADHLDITTLKPIHIIRLGRIFGLNEETIRMAIDALGTNLEMAESVIMESPFGHQNLKQQLIKRIKAGWKQSFASIGKQSFDKL